MRGERLLWAALAFVLLGAGFFGALALLGVHSSTAEVAAVPLFALVLGLVEALVRPDTPSELMTVPSRELRRFPLVRLLIAVASLAAGLIVVAVWSTAVEGVVALIALLYIIILVYTQFPR